MLPGLSCGQGQLPSTYPFNGMYLMKNSTEPVDSPSGGALVPPEIPTLALVSAAYSFVLLHCTEHAGILLGGS